MAGLIDSNLNNEILSEISWIMNAIDVISSKVNIETYEIALIKYRVQPEEEQAISKFFAFHSKDLNILTIDDMQKGISVNFTEITKKQWSLSNDVLEKLITLRRQELGI